MFGLGITEIVIIFVIALVVFGPKKLPELGKALGRGIAEFKRASQEVKETIETEVRNAEHSIDLTKIKNEVEGAVREAKLPDTGSADQASGGPAAEKGTDGYDKS